MAQPANKKNGNSSNTVSFWDSRAHDLLGGIDVRISMGIVAKYNIDPDDIYFDAMLTPAQVTALPANLSEKKTGGNLRKT